MSSDVAISATNVSKTYTIRDASSSATTLGERLASTFRHPLKRTPNLSFPALTDVTFTLAPGDVLGVIGRNGAGKSTLLKVLSRITEPSAGRIELRGRVGSLLEVGTGFHPELTGRENVFLNGALLGMSRREIAGKFSDIVEFAGVERFLDTPVKRYSSGMYVRLAFAVAAHLDADILLVDEVLAVGDADFQEKCLGKMQDVAKGGRTVIFVSHQMQSVLSLCNRGMLLERGSVTATGGIDEVVARYLASFGGAAQSAVGAAESRPGTGELRVAAATLDAGVYKPNDAKVLTVDVERRAELPGQFALNVSLVDGRGNLIAYCDSRLLGQWFEPVPQRLEVCVSEPWLKPGTYRVNVQLLRFGPVIDEWEGAVTFRVAAPLPYAGSLSEDLLSYGLVLPKFSMRRLDPGVVSNA